MAYRQGLIGLLDVITYHFKDARLATFSATRQTMLNLQGHGVTVPVDEEDVGNYNTAAAAI